MFLKVNEKLENPNFEGTESRLYIKEDYLYKIYIDNNSSSLHLQNLIFKQKEIKQTILPDNILYKKIEDKTEHEECNDFYNDCIKLIGCRIKYFKDYTSLNKINCSFDEKLNILINIISPLKELLQHNIYPSDLNADGILVGDKIQIIDLDTFNTKITKDYDKESYLFVLKLFKVIILETIYPDFESIINIKYLEEYLKIKKLKDSLIRDIVKNDFDFKDAKNLIYYLKDRSIKNENR